MILFRIGFFLHPSVSFVASIILCFLKENESSQQRNMETKIYKSHHKVSIVLLFWNLNGFVFNVAKFAKTHALFMNTKLKH